MEIIQDAIEKNRIKYAIAHTIFEFNLRNKLPVHNFPYNRQVVDVVKRQYAAATKQIAARLFFPAYVIRAFGNIQVPAYASG